MLALRFMLLSSHTSLNEQRRDLPPHARTVDVPRLAVEAEHPGDHTDQHAPVVEGRHQPRRVARTGLLGRVLQSRDRGGQYWVEYFSHETEEVSYWVEYFSHETEEVSVGLI